MTVNHKHIPLLLGSASPRRKDLLAQLHIVPDEILAADINEDPLDGELPRPYVMRMATEKNAVLRRNNKTHIILTADTTVVVGRRILGKPADEADARRMIELLSGRAHHVLTAVCLSHPDGRVATRISDTKVTVKRLSKAELDDFIASREWDGKAGGYAIQGIMGGYVRSVIGSFTGVVGLPHFETNQLLTGFGYTKK